MKSILILSSFLVLFISSCGFHSVTKHKDIVYDVSHNLKLDIYQPKKDNELKKVLVFIHGGNWTSGKKSIYKFFGRGMAKKGIVTVVIDYRLSPVTDYEGMAIDASHAVKWVKENIGRYKGDSNEVFVSGHSAGGHLAALIATDQHYFNDLNILSPIKGTILIDAFGLDMYTYLNQYLDVKESIYYHVFSKNPDTWKKASPIFYLESSSPPFMLFLGNKTYPAITKGSLDFMHVLRSYQPRAPLVMVKNKRHAGMIFQFLNPHKKSYKDVIDFMN